VRGEKEIEGLFAGEYPLTRDSARIANFGTLESRLSGVHGAQATQQLQILCTTSEDLESQDSRFPKCTSRLEDPKLLVCTDIAGKTSSDHEKTAESLLPSDPLVSHSDVENGLLATVPKALGDPGPRGSPIGCIPASSWRCPQKRPTCLPQAGGNTRRRVCSTRSPRTRGSTGNRTRRSE
jgi:hypothetical protein